MNTANLKRYAPKARLDFIAAMQKQAANLGITAKHIEPLEVKGDIALIGGRTFPVQIKAARERLVTSVEQQGFAQVMEYAAYSWFNRLCAIRFMELKGYFDHGRRVLSSTHADSHTPQLLEECLDINLESDLPSLDKQRVIDLKLDGTQDEQLFRELLLAQCHALHQVMPFLFEAIDGALELLLPDNLTKTDSLIRELVSAIPEEDWDDVEIIGWLYQFYISDKKDQVIGKVVKSQDIPAATQLFTPNWIVQYLVQNSLGRQWLQTYPDSPLQGQMPYYIAPGEQTPAVQAKLAEIIPCSLEPESIKVLDPAAGSGHILVEAYKILKAIYEERGHRSRDIPLLILTNNLFGLDIDDRAAQLASFTVLMLARADDRRIFSRLAENHVRLNILALQETQHLELDTLWQALNLNKDWNTGASMGLFADDQQDLSAAQADSRYQLLQDCLARFTQAKTFGSLIDVPAEQVQPLHELYQQLQQLAHSGDVMQKPAAEQLLPFVQQAWMLAQRYDAVIANPPYMGSKNLIPPIKEFAKKTFPKTSADLYAMFIERNLELLIENGYVSMITMDSWMYGDEYTSFRESIVMDKNILTMLHLGPRAFPEIDGEVVQVASFVLSKNRIDDFEGIYYDLTELKNSDEKRNQFIKKTGFYTSSIEKYSELPRFIFSYSATQREVEAFRKGRPLKEIAEAFTGLQTGDNEKFIKEWYEVSFSRIGFQLNSREESVKSGMYWFPYVKGSNYRKWYGNNSNIVNWFDDGKFIKEISSSRPQNQNYYFKSGISYNNISKKFSARYVEKGYIFDQKNSMFFSDENNQIKYTLGLLLSDVVQPFLDILSPKDFGPGSMKQIPVLGSKNLASSSNKTIDQLIKFAKKDWNSYESSWDFIRFSLLGKDTKQPMISSSYTSLRAQWFMSTEEMQRLEKENKRIFIDAYGLQDELTPDVPLKEITLTCNPHYRYGGDLTEQQREERLQSDTIAELISYAIGCMMGRYSLDREGLVYAHAGNQGFAELVSEGAYTTFAADDDAILPITEQEWFSDDVTNRVSEFIRTVYDEQHLEENLQFIADSLCLYTIKPKKGERALETIRRYLGTQFYKDHLKTYKRRPIYWLFSSGKHKAFECLVYLHRYHEGTLARMRTEYVIPLTARINARINRLNEEVEAASSTSERKQLMTELKALQNQQAELATFDEQLRHHADQRISLDLDDGVKENYGKFGDLLAAVKDVTGKAAD